MGTSSHPSTAVMAMGFDKYLRVYDILNHSLLLVRSLSVIVDYLFFDVDNFLYIVSKDTVLLMNEECV